MPIELDEDMRAVITAAHLCFAATVTPDGRPNLSPKGTIRVWDTTHLFFLDIASPGTRQNLERNEWLELNVVDQQSRRGYRFGGRAAVHRAGPVFAAATGRVFAEEAVAYPVAAVILLAIEHAAALVSPGYLHVRDEWAMRGHWRARRAALDADFEAHVRARGPWPGEKGD